jgi:sulfoacetaldehyde dehydrogenase
MTQNFWLHQATGIGPEHPVSGEKMALFLALYRASDFADAKAKARAIHDYQGRGHSLGAAQPE